MCDNQTTVRSDINQSENMPCIPLLYSCLAYLFVHVLETQSPLLVYASHSHIRQTATTAVAATNKQTNRTNAENFDFDATRTLWLL